MQALELEGIFYNMKTRKKWSTTKIIEVFNTKHNNFYNYSKLEYVKMHDKIIIICPIHEEFQLTSNQHIRGVGCKKCSIIKNTNKSRDNTESFIQKSKKNTWEFI